MRKDWSFQKLEECIVKINPPKKLKSSDYLLGGLYPIISQDNNVISGYWDEIDDAVHVDQPVVIFGDHTRVIKYVDYDFVVGADGVIILEPIKKLIPKFFFYFLKSCYIPSLGYSRHYKLLKELNVPIPSYDIQQQIVEELDSLTSIIEKQKKQLEEMDNLSHSIFYDMFGDPIENEKGWKTCKVVNVVKMQRGFDLPVQNRITNGKIPIYGSNGIIGFHNESKVDNGIITGRSGTLGKVYECNKPFWPLNTTLFSVDTHGNNITYLRFLMEFFHLERFKSGAGVPTLNRNDFHSKNIPNIPIGLQQQFAAKIEAIEKQKELIKKSIKETEDLFNSRMDYYFN